MSDGRKSVRIEEPQEVIQEEPQGEEVVSVILLQEMILKITGVHTGREYVFRGSGSIIEDVNKEDAEEMVSRFPTIPSCCGSYSAPYLQILGR